MLRKEPAFRNFLVVRSLLAFATLAFAFYTVYAVRFHGISEVQIGVMTGVLLGTQIIANPVMGWFGDRWGHRTVLEAGVIACIASVIIAWLAPHPNWFFLVFILVGIGNVAVWTIGMTMSLEFGTEAERPTFIGLANTLVAPSTILAPFIGGWLADTAGYSCDVWLLHFLRYLLHWSPCISPTAANPNKYFQSSKVSFVLANKVSLYVRLTVTTQSLYHCTGKQTIYLE